MLKKMVLLGASERHIRQVAEEGFRQITLIVQDVEIKMVSDPSEVPNLVDDHTVAVVIIDDAVNNGAMLAFRQYKVLKHRPPVVVMTWAANRAEIEKLGGIFVERNDIDTGVRAVVDILLRKHATAH